MKSRNEDINKDRNTEFFRNKLKLKNLEVKNSFNEKYPHVKKFFEDRGVELGRIRQHSAKIITTGALTGTLLFSPPTFSLNIPPISQIVETVPAQQTVIESLRASL